MYPEIKVFAFIEDRNLYVEFEDGRKGLFDMSKYLVSDFFSSLENDTYFRRAYLEYGVLTWPEGQDISPETVAQELVPFDVPDATQLIRERMKHHKT